MFTPRQKRIIHYLIHQEEFTQIRTLAKMFNVSERTIQYDMEHIEDELENSNTEMVRIKSKGVMMKSDSEIFSLISDVTENETRYFSPDERFEHILLMLFESLEPISSSRLSEFLNVSRRTIVDDLKAVNSWLEKRKLELSYFKNKGFKIIGDEQSYRESYVEILIQHYKDLDTPFHLKFVGKNSIPQIYEAIEVGLNKANYALIQSSIDGLVFHIAISLHRLRNDYKVEMPEKELEKLKNKKEFKVATIIQKEIEKVFEVNFPISEAGYIALHLLGARQSVHSGLDDFEEDESLKSTIINFLKHITRQMGVTVDKDQKLIEGLLIHLKPAIYRIKYGFRNDNPLLQEISRRYPDIIYAIETSLHVLEEQFKVRFNEHEVAFIAIHVGSSIERKSKTKSTDINVLLICGSGIGTSQLLKTRINSYYPELNIVDVLAYTKLQDSYFKAKEIDLIISTIFMENQPVKVINVSPFLGKEDREQLNNHINEHRENVVQKSIEIGPALNQLMNPKHILWEVESLTWENAISKTVAPLIEDSIVKQDYSDEIIKQFNLYGPYMVIGENIALIHASSHNYVNQTGFSFIKLKHPVKFGHSRYDPVIYIICLATTSPKIHLNALRQLSFILMDNNHIKRLRNNGRSGLIKSIDEVSTL